ncbi:Platelet-activating factor acetylhydrolase, isoform II, partial [Rhizoctonia solani]
MRLPDYKGKFPVGVTTLTKPIRPSRVCGSARFNGRPALKLEEIAYGVYYPTTEDRPHGTRGVNWLPRPLHIATAGWAKFACTYPNDIFTWHKTTLTLTIFSQILLIDTGPLVYLFARFIKLPVYADAPLRPQIESLTSRDTDSSAETLTSSTAKWPLVIFSHGLAGGRFTYSDYCGRLASQGMVVIALEHRDGSGPSVMPTDEETGKPIPKLYFQNDDISWEEQPKGKLPLRVEQLKFRIREIYESYESFKHIVQGNRGDTVSMDNFSDWDSFKDQVDFSKILLTGHSFGGATSLSLLSSPPPEGHNQLPIDKVVLLDPWMDPLPLPGTLPVAYETRPPLLIMNSEGFTLWKEHFEVLQQVVSDWRKSGGDECASLVTIVRSQHHYYSDFGAFMPFGKARELGLLVLDIAHKLTMAYNNGSLASELKGKRSMEIKPIPGKDKYGESKREIVGQPGEVIIH